MATNRRNKVIAEPVGPSFLPGLAIYADTVTGTNGEAFTVVFPAKTVIGVFTQCVEDTDAAKVVSSSSVTGNEATVTFTKTGNGLFSYLILASVTETIPAKSAVSGEVINPVQ